MTLLTGRRVLITGAAGGLGPTVAHTAARAGASLLLAGRTASSLEALAEELGESIESVHGVDLLDDDAVAELARDVCSERPVDVVWHLVGGWRGGRPLAEQPLADWDLLHDLLVRTTVHVTRAFAGPLAASAHGRFAIVSAKAAQSPTSKNAAYASAKAAAEAVVLAMADDFSGTSATANIVSVTAIVTAAMKASEPDKTWPGFVTAEDIADSLVYLASSAASAMNGQRIRLYSGSPA